MRRSEQFRDRFVECLQDAHSLERTLGQRIETLLAGVVDETLERLLSWHLHIIWMHEVRLRSRLESAVDVPSSGEDVADAELDAARDGGQPLAPWKAALELYVMAQRQVATYEFLRRLAAQVGDTDTHDLAALHLSHAEQFGDEVAECWDEFLELPAEAGKPSSMTAMIREPTRRPADRSPLASTTPTDDAERPV